MEGVTSLRFGTFRHVIVFAKVSKRYDSTNKEDLYVAIILLSGRVYCVSVFNTKNKRIDEVTYLLLRTEIEIMFQ